MSNTSEYDSKDETSPGSLEYHSRQEPELDQKQIILVNRNEEFTFLQIRFPMPPSYPHPYIWLCDLMTTVKIAPASYDRITNIPGDPNQDLGYILHHFNINRVSHGIRAYPPYNLDQVYYSTYIEPIRYQSLINYYNITQKQSQNALEQERLELQIKYGRYLITDDIPITLLDCLLFL